MKYIEDNNGEQVSIHDLCYLIYQGFGQHSVHNFAERNIPEATWLYCQGCDVISPIFEDACLVCGNNQPTKKDN